MKKYDNFKESLSCRVGKKKQIILCHTGREVEDYLTSLTLRYNGKYDKIPNYIVTRNGDVIKLLEDNQYTNFMCSDLLSKKSIVVVLENLGWLEKKQLAHEYINWLGNIYNGEVYEKKWRDYLFWEPYTENQVIKTAELCDKILSDNSINRFVMNHNTKVMNADKLEGILYRSNYDTMFTDLSPSFDFDNFVKYITNE